MTLFFRKLSLWQRMVGQTLFLSVPLQSNHFIMSNKNSHLLMEYSLKLIDRVVVPSSIRADMLKHIHEGPYWS